LAGLEQTYDVARELMASPYEEHREQGAKLMEQAITGVREYDKLQETQRIADETAEKAAIAAMGKETWERHKFLVKEYDDATASHRDIRKQAQTARTLLSESEAMSDMTAVKLVERMVNSGTVLLSEAQTYREAGGFVDKVESFKKAMRDGTFTDTMRVQLRGIIAQVEQDTHADQLGYRSSYLERAEDAQIEERYWDNYEVAPLPPVDVPTDKYGNPDMSQLSKPELRRLASGE
jgi:hypothetical protein